ncbi:MAG: radical SAM protein, partial [Candidatus Aenigmatarchaeota archaeon]
MGHNLNSEIRRIEKWCNGKKSPPTKVDIFPTKRCNLNCKFCEFPNTDPEEYKSELETGELLRIVKEARGMNVKTFGIIGGEPFIHKDMIKIMEKVKEGGMDGSITTNGTLLNDEKIKKIINMKWDLLRISIDGIEKTHDKLRGKTGTFSKVIENINRFKQDSRTYPTIEINTVL